MKSASLKCAIAGPDSGPRILATHPRLRRWLRWLLRPAVVAIVLVLAVTGFWLRRALYHRFVQFPREEAAWQELRSQRQSVPADAGGKEFRGILHSHSELSHDCEVPFEEILRVLQATGIDFICLSDHRDEGRAGRGFVGFDVIADSTSFRWVAEDGTASAVMGETLHTLARQPRGRGPCEALDL